MAQPIRKPTEDSTTEFDSEFKPDFKSKRDLEASGRAVGEALGAAAHQVSEVARQAREARRLAEKGWVETRRLWRDLATTKGRGQRVGVLVVAGICAGFILGATLGIVRTRR